MEKELNFFTENSLNKIKPLLKINKLKIDHENEINEIKLEFFPEEKQYEIKENFFNKDIYDINILRFISKHYSKLEKSELISLLELNDDKITRYITKYQRNIDDEIFEKYDLNPSTFSFYKAYNENREYKVSHKFYQEKIKPNIDWNYIVESEKKRITIDFINKKKSIDNKLKKKLIKIINKNNKEYDKVNERERESYNGKKSIAFYAKKYKLNPNEHNYILDKINKNEKKYRIEKEELEKDLTSSTFTESGDVITQAGSDINNLDTLMAISGMSVVNTGGHTVINFNNKNLIVTGTLTLSSDRYSLFFNIHTGNFGLEVNGNNAELNIGRFDSINGSDRYYQRSILKFDRDTSNGADNTTGDILITNGATFNWIAGILENKQSIVFDTNSNVTLTSGVFYGNRSSSHRIRQLSTNLSINAPNGEFLQTTGSLRFDFFQAPQMAIGFFPNHGDLGGFQVLSSRISGGSDDLFEFRRFRSAGLTYDYDAFANARLEFVNSFDGIIITGTHNNNNDSANQPATLHYKEFRLQFIGPDNNPVPNVRYFLKSSPNLGTSGTSIPNNIRWNSGETDDLTVMEQIEGESDSNGLTSIIKVNTQFDIQGQSRGGTLGSVHPNWRGDGTPIKFYRSQSNDNNNGYDILASSFWFLRASKRIDLDGPDVNTIVFDLEIDEGLSTDDPTIIRNRPYVTDLQELYDNSLEFQRVLGDLSSSRIFDYFVRQGSQIATDLDIEFDPLLTEEFVEDIDNNKLSVKLGALVNGELVDNTLNGTSNLDLLRANNITFINGANVGNIRTVIDSTNSVRLVLLTPNNLAYKGTITDTDGDTTQIDYTTISNGVIAISGQQNSVVRLVISPFGFDERLLGFNLGENGIIQSLDFIPIADFEVDSTSITDNLDITYSDTDQSLTIQYQSSADVRFSSDLYSSLLNFIRRTEAYLDAVLDINDINLLSIFSVGNLAQKDTLTTRWTIQDDREPIAQFLIPIWITPAQANTNILTPRNNVRSFISIIFVNTSVEIDNDAIRQINNQENQRIVDLLNNITNQTLNNVDNNLSNIESDLEFNKNLILNINKNPRLFNDVTVINDFDFNNAGEFFISQLAGEVVPPTQIITLEDINNVRYVQFSISSTQSQKTNFTIEYDVAERVSEIYQQIILRVSHNNRVGLIVNPTSFKINVSISNGIRGESSFEEYFSTNNKEINNLLDIVEEIYFPIFLNKKIIYNRININVEFNSMDIKLLLSSINVDVRDRSVQDDITFANLNTLRSNISTDITNSQSNISDDIDATQTFLSDRITDTNTNINNKFNENYKNLVNLKNALDIINLKITNSKVIRNYNLGLNNVLHLEDADQYYELSIPETEILEYQSNNFIAFYIRADKACILNIRSMYDSTNLYEAINLDFYRDINRLVLLVRNNSGTSLATEGSDFILNKIVISSNIADVNIKVENINLYEDNDLLDGEITDNSSNELINLSNSLNSLLEEVKTISDGDTVKIDNIKIVTDKLNFDSSDRLNVALLQQSINRIVAALSL